MLEPNFGARDTSILAEDSCGHLRAIALDDKDLVTGLIIGGELCERGTGGRRGKKDCAGGADAIAAAVVGVRGRRIGVGGNDVELVKASCGVGVCGGGVTRACGFV